MEQNETVNQEEQRTFTQEELDAIVGDRLKRERAKYTDFETLKEKAEKFDQLEEQNKSELQKMIEQRDALQAQLDYIKSANQIREVREKVSQETGIPANLLTGETEEDCKAQAEAIAAYAAPKGYPRVRDGGEITKQVKPTKEQQFADWLEQTLR